LGFAEKTLSEIWYKLKVDGFSNVVEYIEPAECELTEQHLVYFVTKCDKEVKGLIFRQKKCDFFCEGLLQYDCSSDICLVPSWRGTCRTIKGWWKPWGSFSSGASGLVTHTTGKAGVKMNDEKMIQ